MKNSMEGINHLFSFFLMLCFYFSIASDSFWLSNSPFIRPAAIPTAAQIKNAVSTICVFSFSLLVLFNHLFFAFCLFIRGNFRCGSDFENIFHCADTNDAPR